MYRWNESVERKALPGQAHSKSWRGYAYSRQFRDAIRKGARIGFDGKQHREASWSARDLAPLWSRGEEVLAQRGVRRALRR